MDFFVSFLGNQKSHGKVKQKGSQAVSACATGRDALATFCVINR